MKRLLGPTLLHNLNEHAIRRYMKARIDDGACGRTINAEVGELSRAIGKPWSILWPRVRKMEERKDVGKALSSEEEAALLNALSHVRSSILPAFVRIALLTGMRCGEILGLTWGQVDFARKVLTVGRAKTAAGTGRQIPMNQELFVVLSGHAAWFTSRFGGTTPDQYLFPYGKPWPQDPSRPTTTIKTAWNNLREEKRDADGNVVRPKLNFRLHDLRHTAATKMAEAGVPESTMLALMGHVSRAMLERYSHIRMAAKRDAVQALTTKPRTAKPEQDLDGAPTKVPTVGDTASVV